MGISFYSRGLAIAAMAIGAGFASLGINVPALNNSAAAFAAETNTAGKALGLNVGSQAAKEAAAFAAMIGAGNRHGGHYVKHRGPGERAHARWRHARASGIKGANRG